MNNYRLLFVLILIGKYLNNSRENKIIIVNYAVRLLFTLLIRYRLSIIFIVPYK